MTKCIGRQAAVLGWGWLWGWVDVTVICISLWLTRWARLSLKSQGSQLRGPPSDTSPHFTGPTSFYFGHAHFPSLSPTLSPLSLSPSMSPFWGPSERWKMACSWPTTSFPSSGSAVHRADRDPRTSSNESSPHSHRSLLLAWLDGQSLLPLSGWPPSSHTPSLHKSWVV